MYNVHVRWHQKNQFIFKFIFKAHRVEWRKDSQLEDGSDVGLDLVGGWYDGNI